MTQTNAARQRAWRERHRGEPRGNPAMQALLAALQARVAQLEVELAAMPADSPRAPSGRLLELFLALRRERDELAVTLAQIEAFAPGIAGKAKAGVEQVDRGVHPARLRFYTVAYCTPCCPLHSGAWLDSDQASTGSGRTKLGMVRLAK